MPSDYTFNGQRSNEKVIEVANSHAYILYPPGVRALILMVLGVTVVLFWPLLYLISVGLFLLAGIIFFSAFYGFKESVMIITNQRLIAIDQKGFFNRTISETDLFKILDISSDSSGFSKTLLKLGDLIIRTSGARERGDIIVKNISNPYYYQQEITRLMKKQQDTMS